MKLLSSSQKLLPSSRNRFLLPKSCCLLREIAFFYWVSEHFSIEEAAEMMKKSEEAKRRSSRTTAEEEYEKVVLVTNTNRDDSIIEAPSVEEALAQMTVAESLPVDRHPERRLKASFKVHMLNFSLKGNDYLVKWGIYPAESADYISNTTAMNIILQLKEHRMQFTEEYGNYQLI